MLHQKMFKILTIVFVSVFLFFHEAFAQDITAIDFKGSVIGKVIPDGTAVNLQNEIIGQLTADGWILDSKNEIVGGIVPQGFVIGHDQKYLGKVSNDGSVRLPSGKIAGKVLPNGLVVSELYEVIGAVLSSGIIYNDEGAAVGRLAGNGTYVRFDGQSVGFVSPLGYAYRKTQNEPVLEGKLISAKMVVDLNGHFIGSLSAGGDVTDFEGTFIGKVHANGFVYDQAGQVLGSVVQSRYAFDYFGKYLGYVSYNGEVLQSGRLIGRCRADGKIVDLAGEIVGFSLYSNAVAVAENGTFLGYLTPSGRVMRGDKEVGVVASRGLVVQDNQVVGYIADQGPVFDYLGRLKAEAMPNGQVVSFNGATIGYMLKNRAFDRTGYLMGETMKDSVVMNASFQALGPVGVGSEVKFGADSRQISPFGYVYNSDMNISGDLFDLENVYNEEGKVLGLLDVNGGIENQDNLKIKSGGYVLNEKNQVKARQIHPNYFALYDKKEPLYLSEINTLYDSKGAAQATILPEYKIVNGVQSNSLMPIVGFAGDENGVVVNLKGEVEGYISPTAEVWDEGQKIGHLISDKVAVSSQNSYLGTFVPFRPVLEKSCRLIGVMSGKGEIRSGRDNNIGRVLNNGQAVSEVGQYIGYMASVGPVYDFQNRLVGIASKTGEVLDGVEKKGCVTFDGRLYDENEALVGRVFSNAPVMSFENQIIGRNDIQGSLIDNGGNNGGFISPDGTALSQEGKPLGSVFKYQFAFDLQNNFVGYVLPDGNAYNGQNELFGSVAYDGSIVSNKKTVGYALYDLYVYNGKNEAVGYVTNKGMVKNFAGDNLGKVDRGFLVSDNKLIGRGNRDYFVRDNAHRVIGEILLSGDVRDHGGRIIGTVSETGDVRDEKGKLLAVAKPLQYYDVRSSKAASWAKTPQADMKVSAIQAESPEDMKIGGYNQKVIGVVLSPDGQYVGDLLDNGFVIDPNTGEVIGYSQDGVAYDQEGEVIGSIEEKQEKKVDNVKVNPVTSSNIFLPQDAYGITNTPTNLGPGGGYGPNERYDPVRSRALSMVQSERMSNIKMGVVTSDLAPSSYTGYQDNWDNANFIMSSWRVDMSEMILADKPIPAVLARTIMNSGVGDVPVTAIVERNVYAEDGRNIVIPAGSRVIGKSGGGGAGGNGNATTGATRVDITWERLVRPDGSAFEFKSAQTGDAQGRGGALGYLDPQLVKRYAFPVSLAFMQGAINVAMAQGDTSTNENGTTTQDARAAAFQDARDNVNQTIQQIIEQVISDKMESVQSISYVPAGTRLIIYPKTDMWIRTAEREKAQEKALGSIDKPTVLMDDRDPYGSTHGTSSGSSGNSTVVYDGNTNAQPANSGGTPLLNEQPTQPQRPAGAPAYTPPPSTSSSSNAGSSSGSSSSESDASAGQLF